MIAEQVKELTNKWGFGRSTDRTPTYGELPKGSAEQLALIKDQISVWDGRSHWDLRLSHELQSTNAPTLNPAK